jgi:hypothetical protein
MTQPFATLGGFPAAHVVVHVPATGPWWADVDFVEEPTLSAGPITLALGALELVGTVDPRAGGTFGLQRRMRLVAGGGGWATLLVAKAWHNDAGIRARTIAEDAARLAGETLGGFAPVSERIGVDYVRQAGPASRVLEDVIGGAEWWVDYDGVTQVGARAASPAAAGAYELVEYNPRTRLAVLAMDDLGAVGIGTVLSERLDELQTVRELVVDVTPEEVRVRVWCGDSRSSRMAGIFRSLVDRATDGKLHGLWRYRVVRMAGGEGDNTRVELQAMSRAAGLPDVLPISVMPGLPGCYAQLTPGTEVAVQFLEGKRTQPIVTHYVGKGGPGFVPSRLFLGSDSDPAGAARNGDPVRVTIPALSVLIAASGGVLNPTPITLDGTITAGSDIVRIG